jgi:hypothetical protein
MRAGKGGFEVHLWSAGIAMDILMAQTLPFFSTNGEYIAFAVTNQEISFPETLLDAFSWNFVDPLKQS